MSFVRSLTKGVSMHKIFKWSCVVKELSKIYLDSICISNLLSNLQWARIHQQSNLTQHAYVFDNLILSLKQEASKIFSLQIPLRTI